LAGGGDRVDALIEHKHGSDHRWQTARHQEQIISQLLSEGLVAGRLLILEPVS
jgi:hypothetical protein